MKEQFGSTDVVDFLKEKTNITKKTAKLKHLNKVVNEEHEARRQKAEACGLNLARKEALAAIKAECALPPPSVLSIADESAQCDEGDSRLDVGATAGTSVEDASMPCNVPLPGDFSQICNMCRGEYVEQHHFYHQLCPRCAELNWEKRQQTSDMSGMVCVVTGGRVRIGYCIVLKLLRAGAFVLTTTRFPNDCALRYSREPDYEVWRDRLEVCGPVELSDMRLVERFCDQLEQRFSRIHVLINNAAQTLTRPAGWNARMIQLENTATSSLPQSARHLLRLPTQLTESLSIADAEDEATSIVPAARARTAEEVIWVEASQLEDFPEGQLDESRQPLDLSAVNSWSRRLNNVSTLELLQTLAANAAAPFIMCNRLTSVIAPKTDSEPFGHIINVSALEGKFSVKRKSSNHPHTNMAKAGLNMLTHTSANDLFQRHVLMNCVDTGWVTDMAPGGVGVVASTHVTHVATPLDEEDGAARVLDPVFLHLNDPTWLIRGKFFKNYYVAAW
jgi:NAD(P)-dependent dehydrogenase (short-subunit alcohol dehydrogenase family)